MIFALAAIVLTGMPTALRNTLADLRFATFQRHASGNIVVIAIDAPSIDAIGVWPWPRKLHAELIDKLVSAGVSGIAFDIDFSTPSTPDPTVNLPQRCNAPAGRSFSLALSNQKIPTTEK